jgi:hypothetical protein
VIDALGALEPVTSYCVCFCQELLGRRGLGSPMSTIITLHVQIASSAVRAIGVVRRRDVPVGVLEVVLC